MPSTLCGTLWGVMIQCFDGQRQLEGSRSTCLLRARPGLPHMQVQRALLPSLGGNPAASMDEVIARLARAKVDLLFSRSPPAYSATIARA